MSCKRGPAYPCWLLLFFTANLATLGLMATGRFFMAAAVFFLPVPWYAWQILHPASRGLGPAVNRFNTDQREVWLTIDDGPHPASTPAMLDLLDTHRARATFFLVGDAVASHPGLVSEILRRGHAVGNHSASHPHNTFWLAGPRRTAREIDRCEALLRACGATGPIHFRPPVGIKNHSLHPTLARRGLDLVLWSARGFDTLGFGPARSLALITRRLSPGSIILLHEVPGRMDDQLTLAARLLEHLDREGYRCVIPQPENLRH